MGANAESLRKLSALFKNKELYISADTHSIGLYGDEYSLEKTVQENLIIGHFAFSLI